MAESQTSEIWRVQILDAYLCKERTSEDARQDSGGARPSVARVSGGRRQIY